jgi:hypothetical protein
VTSVPYPLRFQMAKVEFLRLSEKWLEGVWSPRSVAINSDRWRVFCSSEPLVGSRFEAHFDFSDSLSTHSGE